MALLERTPNPSVVPNVRTNFGTKLVCIFFGPNIGKFGIELGVFGGEKHDGQGFEALRLNLKGNGGLKCKNTQPTEKKTIA